MWTDRQRGTQGLKVGWNFKRCCWLLRYRRNIAYSWNFSRPYSDPLTNISPNLSPSQKRVIRMMSNPNYDARKKLLLGNISYLDITTSVWYNFIDLCFRRKTLFSFENLKFVVTYLVFTMSHWRLITELNSRILYQYTGELVWGHTCRNTCKVA